MLYWSKLCNVECDKYSAVITRAGETFQATGSNSNGSGIGFIMLHVCYNQSKIAIWFYRSQLPLGGFVHGRSVLGDILARLLCVSCKLINLHGFIIIRYITDLEPDRTSGVLEEGVDGVGWETAGLVTKE